MASNVVKVRLGLEMTEPNWALLCFGITGPAMRALGYLESGNVELAMESLRQVQSVCDIAMMCGCTASEPEPPEND